MRMVSFLLLFQITVAPVLAAIPTSEGLFRTGFNTLFSRNTSDITFKLNEIENEELLNNTDADEEGKVEGAALSRQLSEFNIRLKLFFEDEKPTQMLQEVYDGRTNALIKRIFHPNMGSTLANSIKVEQGLFYSMMVMLFTNNKKLINSYLDQINPDYKTNEEIANKEKLDLYGEYARFLKVTKEDKSLRGKLDSPLRPVNEEERENVQKIMNSPTYIDPESVSLAKVGDRFFWQLKLQNLVALFSNEKHYPHRIMSGEFQMEFGEYMLINGQQESPRIILVTMDDGTQYRVRVNRVRNRNLKEKDLSTSFLKSGRDSGVGNPNEYSVPPFLLLE